ncbi:MAG TPA: MarR family transcriptional regulator [Syntrophomonadaceae bacterium]|nr:MarR family transcriptional regulator [Syntrophomonadaceae bacterium]HRX21266.1 MarR family transcriptional regulator [Syntrophomonadaceae bacterium]
MQDFTTFICYSLKATMKKVEKHIGQELEKYGVSMAQSFVLFSLLENDGATLSEIGALAHIENSSLTTMVDKLEKEGLVERSLFPQDRRVIRLFLTDAGRKLALEVLSAGAALNQEFGNNLGDLQPNLLEGLKIVASTIDDLNKTE